MMQKHIRVSLVIPVYNEERHLRDCLESIASQTVRPYEVIVVDNNSTDESINIARSFEFVRVVREKRQGVVFARDAGFNAARGEIIGRIDADSQLPAGWIETVQNIFTNHTVDAVSGKIHYYDQVFWRIGDKIDNYCRRHLARLQTSSDTVFLQAANMAIRQKAWIATRHAVCHLDGIHEDFDLAVHLQRHGFRVSFAERLEAGISSRRIDCSFFKFLHYLRVCPRTYAIHGIRSRIYMYPIGLIWVLIYIPSYIGYRGYDSSTGKFSLEQLLSTRTITGRIDPSILPSLD